MLVVLATGKSLLWQQNNSDGRKVFEMGAVKGHVFYKELAFKHFCQSFIVDVPQSNILE